MHLCNRRQSPAHPGQSVVQLLARMPAFAFFLVGTIIVWYIRPYSCTHYVETWLGLLPISISVSSTTMALSYLAWPVNDDENTWMMNVRTSLHACACHENSVLAEAVTCFCTGSVGFKLVLCMCCVLSIGHVIFMRHAVISLSLVRET